MSILPLVDQQGDVFWPRRKVAMVREEFSGRLEALSEDGALAWRSGPLDAVAGAPFVMVVPGTLVHPAHATPDGDHLLLPGGWRIPGALPPPSPPEPPEADPEVPFVGVRESEVLYLEVNRRTSIWWTDRGPVEPAEFRRRQLKGRAQAAFHPGLVAAGRDWFVNPLRVRFMRRMQPHGTLVGFDTGATITLGHKGAPALAANLGVDRTESPLQAGLRLLGIRRWPVRLADAPAEYLQRHFGDAPERLIANLAFQTVDDLRGGIPNSDGRGHRPYFYVPTRAALYRAGLLETAGAVEIDESRWLYEMEALEKGPFGDEEAWNLMCRVLARLVGEFRFFTYREMHFRDQKPQYRLVGPRAPHVVLLVEKESLLEPALDLHRRFGVTVLISGGVPALVATEFLCEDLRRLGVTEVLILSYCDHDPVGWDMPAIFGAQFERYGVAVQGIRRLITPDLFTPDEVRRLAVPLPSRGKQWNSRVRRWVKETGGVNGQALGLSANLVPLERVAAALEAALPR